MTAELPDDGAAPEGVALEEVAPKNPTTAGAVTPEEAAAPAGLGDGVPEPEAGPVQGPTSRLLAGAQYYTDEELVAALRSQVAELTSRAGLLEDQVRAAQARLGALVAQARARSGEAEETYATALVPKARQEALAIVTDARRRAAELTGAGPAGVEAGTTGEAVEMEDLGRLLVTHFELQERLVNLIAQISSEVTI